jgi:hypothetical protein
VDLDDVRRHIEEVPGAVGCMICTPGTITAGESLHLHGYDKGWRLNPTR